MDAFLNYVVKNLVSNPEEVVISRHEDGDKVTYHIAANRRDLGKVIGKNGQVISAIRDLIQAVAPADQRVFVEVVD